jgi:hypothetical protein
VVPITAADPALAVAEVMAATLPAAVTVAAEEMLAGAVLSLLNGDAQ